MSIKNVSPLQDGFINVIIETPKGSQNKFDYDQKLKLFKLNKTLPMGTVFPFDFGFVPGTLGEDGDPLDVLVIMDQPAYPGIMVECRLVGVLEALQKQQGEKDIRNDRMVAVPHCSIMYGNIQKLKELNKGMVAEIENFFVDYNKHEGRKFTPVQWHGAEEALKLIHAGIEKYRSGE